MNTGKRCGMAAAVMVAAASWIAAAPADGPTALERRWSLLDAFRQEGAGAVPALVAGLEDEAPFVQRTAAHLLARLGEPALPGIEKALQHPDFQVRRIAMEGLQEMGLMERYRDILVADLEDQDLSVRRAAALSLARLGEPALPGIEKALQNPDFQVRRIAIFGLKEMGLLQRYWDVIQQDEHPTIRREVEEMRFEARFDPIAEFPLPAEGWKFKLDPEDEGREEGWFASDYDDSDWMDARIEASWNDFLPEQYVGVAWYRRRVDVPRLPAGDELYLEFTGVDESAWVWVNGEYAGEHDVGPSGWDLPFRIDVARLIKPGEKNLIAVRAMNTAFEGGIWRPITLRAYHQNARP